MTVQLNLSAHRITIIADKSVASHAGVFREPIFCPSANKSVTHMNSSVSRSIILLWNINLTGLDNRLVLGYSRKSTLPQGKARRKILREGEGLTALEIQIGEGL